jgi:hypothetical protein
MCIIQCIDCVCCDFLTLIPLKSDYFNGGDYRHFRNWARLDLVRRFRNAGKIYTTVYDEMCMNTECPRRKSDYTPKEGEKVDSHCGSVHCNNLTCRLVACRGEDYCFEHHPRSQQLLKKAPVFRVRIYNDADLRHVDRFSHFMKHVDQRDGRTRRPFPFV